MEGGRRAKGKFSNLDAELAKSEQKVQFDAELAKLAIDTDNVQNQSIVCSKFNINFAETCRRSWIWSVEHKE